MTVFGLLRHGKTSWNMAKRIQGQLDSPLVEESVVQALKWGQQLQVGNWSRILCSDLPRARHTAELINETLCVPIHYETGLREQDWGIWSGHSLRTIREDYQEELDRMLPLGWRFQPPGGEDRLSVWQRALQTLVDAISEGSLENILVVTHQGVIKCLMYRSLGRAFLPHEPQLIQDEHLHLMVWDAGELRVKQPNAMALSTG